jgi:hypothetical protein
MCRLVPGLAGEAVTDAGIDPSPDRAHGRQLGPDRRIGQKPDGSFVPGVDAAFDMARKGNGLDGIERSGQSGIGKPLMVSIIKLQKALSANHHQSIRLRKKIMMIKPRRRLPIASAGA